ncbi:MAG: hypothetical protein AB7O73_03920 [Bacteroidia bacterium]
MKKYRMYKNESNYVFIGLKNEDEVIEFSTIAGLWHLSIWPHKNQNDITMYLPEEIARSIINCYINSSII